MRRLLADLRQRVDLWKARPWFYGVLLCVALAASALVALTLGAVSVPLGEILPALRDVDHPLHAVLADVRAPRVLGAILVGAALATSGALMQAVVRNPLADPGLIGVTSGAGLAALLAIVLMPEATLLLPVFAFAGAAAALAVLLSAVAFAGRAPAPLRIILSGVALQAVFFGLIALTQFFFADRAPAFVAFIVGSLNGMGWGDVATVTVPTLAGIALAYAAVRALNLLMLDDASALGVGLSVGRARVAASSLAALLAAGAVSVAGLVAFVGLVVPNWVRLAVGPDHRLLLPLAVLGGATLVLVADTVGRTVVAPFELPVGALLAVLGGPYFLFVLWRKLA